MTRCTRGISPLRTSKSNERKQTDDEILRWYLIYMRAVTELTSLADLYQHHAAAMFCGSLALKST